MPTQLAGNDGLGRALRFIYRQIKRTGDIVGQPQQQLMHPFFMYWAPKLPHDGFTPGAEFAATYEKRQGQELEAGARLSLVDLQMATLTEHMKRWCYCDNDGQRQSVFDQTVIFYMGDHGWLLPDAKNGEPVENVHRMPLLISEPRHRTGVSSPLTPRVLGVEFAHAADLLRTVANYAGITYTERVRGLLGSPWYPWSVDLKALLDEEKPETDDFAAYTGTARRRRAQYGETGDGGVVKGGGTNDSPQTRYIIPQRGLLRVCDTAVGPVGKERMYPCMVDEDCPSGAGSCNANGLRCVNVAKKCTTNAECVQGLCAGTTCSSSASANGRFKDFAGTTVCSSVDGACAPSAGSGNNLCRPMLMKFVNNDRARPLDPDPKEERIDSAYDLDLDPDQKTSLQVSLINDKDIAAKMAACLNNFWTLDLGVPPRGTPEFSGSWQGWQQVTDLVAGQICPWPLNEP